MTVLLISLIGAAAPSFAQTYLQRPVRIIVNVSAGGGVDITARALALHFGSVFKQPFIVDNRTGAGATSASNWSPKRRRTVTRHLPAAAASSPTQRFVPRTTTQCATFSRSPIWYPPGHLVVTPSLPVKAVQDLVALAKAKPEFVRYGTSVLAASSISSSCSRCSRTRR